MARWVVYTLERFPPLVYLLLTGGLVFSGYYLASPVLKSHHLVPLLYAWVGLLIFFYELRLMDEFKDFDKDIIANPDRPLPRGLLQIVEVRVTINNLLVVMIGWAGMGWFVVNPAAALIYLGLTGYLFLMYVEFFCGPWLSRKPFFYAITHQVVLFPLCMLTVAAINPQALAYQRVFGYCLAVFGSFFTYEICRKLDPKANPVLGTYLIFYGRGLTTMLILITSTFAIWGASLLGLDSFLTPCMSFLLLLMMLLYIRPAAYKFIEGWATITLVMFIWSVVIENFL